MRGWTTRAQKRARRLRAITRDRRDERRARMLLDDLENQKPEPEFDIIAALKKLAEKSEEGKK